MRLIALTPVLLLHLLSCPAPAAGRPAAGAAAGLPEKFDNTRRAAGTQVPPWGDKTDGRIDQFRTLWKEREGRERGTSAASSSAPPPPPPKKKMDTLVDNAEAREHGKFTQPRPYGEMKPAAPGGGCKAPKRKARNAAKGLQPALRKRQAAADGNGYAYPDAEDFFRFAEEKLGVVYSQQELAAARHKLEDSLGAVVKREEERNGPDPPPVQYDDEFLAFAGLTRDEVAPPPRNIVQDEARKCGLDKFEGIPMRKSVDTPTEQPEQAKPEDPAELAASAEPSATATASATASASASAEPTESAPSEKSTDQPAEQQEKPMLFSSHPVLDLVGGFMLPGQAGEVLQISPPVTPQFGITGEEIAKLTSQTAPQAADIGAAPAALAIPAAASVAPQEDIANPLDSMDIVITSSEKEALILIVEDIRRCIMFYDLLHDDDVVVTGAGDVEMTLSFDVVGPAVAGPVDGDAPGHVQPVQQDALAPKPFAVRPALNGPSLSADPIDGGGGIANSGTIVGVGLGVIEGGSAILEAGGGGGGGGGGGIGGGGGGGGGGGVIALVQPVTGMLFNPLNGRALRDATTGAPINVSSMNIPGGNTAQFAVDPITGMLLNATTGAPIMNTAGVPVFANIANATIGLAPAMMNTIGVPVFTEINTTFGLFGPGGETKEMGNALNLASAHMQRKQFDEAIQKANPRPVGDDDVLAFLKMVA
ncbi:hypothetical protein FN846DRAFT_895810 [Sphaerosporella brunnea]|uniref:Uncharacterized protein n=1 Tax=Sphaerosporella brunnea TaxID=1250544 RepID=A0A5J5EDG5_9PEZI|nr:hypothetical protein FN846DRAFT_895810 [Sphaerosporella brunnea]